MRDHPADAAWGAVLFDLDGTLIDPRAGIVGSLRAALRSLELPVPSDAVLASHIGPPLPTGLAALGVAPGRLGDAVAAYRREFEAIGPAGATVHPGIPALLDDVAASGAQLAVATSKPTVIARTVLTEQGLDRHFGVVCGADLDERNSDKQTVIARALVELGGPPAELVVMVGDRSHDVLGARAQGIAAVAVGWGFATAGELASCRPRWVAHDVAELRGVLIGSAP